MSIMTDGPYKPKLTPGIYNPGAKWVDLKSHLDKAKAGALTFPIAAKNGMTILERYPSKSRAGSWYYIIRGKDGNIYCDCNVWRMRKACQHLQEYLEDHEVITEKDVFDDLEDQEDVDNFAISELSRDESKVINESNVIEDLQDALAKTEAKLAKASYRLNELRTHWGAVKKLFMANVRLTKTEMDAADQLFSDVDDLLV